MTENHGNTGRTFLNPLFSWRGAIVSRQSDLQATVRHVALTLSLHMNEAGGSCFPSIATLVGESGHSERTVQRALRVLENEGWLAVRHGVGRGHPNIYTAEIPEKVSHKPRFSGPLSEEKVSLVQEKVSLETLKGVTSADLGRHEDVNRTSTTIPTSSFEAFWAAYPRRVGKGEALKAWMKAVKTTDPELLISAATAFATQRSGADPKFTPHPSTWLNQQRWFDDPDPQFQAVPEAWAAIEFLEHLNDT